MGYLQGSFHKDSDFCIKNADLYFNLLSYWTARIPINMIVVFEFLMKECFLCMQLQGSCFFSVPDTKKSRPRIYNEKRWLWTRHVAGFVFVLSWETLRSPSKIWSEHGRRGKKRCSKTESAFFQFSWRLFQFTLPNRVEFLKIKFKFRNWKEISSSHVATCCVFDVLVDVAIVGIGPPAMYLHGRGCAKTP